jgi:hypothetical protein
MKGGIMRWKVTGVEKATGNDVAMVIDAASERLAIDVAAGRGMMIEKVVSQGLEPGPLTRQKYGGLDATMRLFIGLACIIILLIDVPAAIYLIATTPTGPTYQGRPLDEWIRLTHDKDTKTQLAAVAALCDCIGEAKAERALDECLESGNLSVSFAIIRHRRYDREIVRKAVPIIRRELAKGHVALVADEFVGVFEALGDDAKVFRADVQKMIDGTKDTYTRSKYQEMLDAIPK